MSRRKIRPKARHRQYTTEEAHLLRSPAALQAEIPRNECVTLDELKRQIFEEEFADSEEALHYLATH